MPLPGKKAFFRDYVFYVSENVYEPAEDSFLFAESLIVKEGGNVLDMGTGCGILSIIAAKKAAGVVAVDINPYAVNCAKENARLNGVAEKIYFVQGDLFAPIKREERFDLILFNAPYLPSETSEDDSWLEYAWAGGVTGRSVIDRFLWEAPQYLKKSGCVLLMQSTLSGINETLEGFAEKGLKASIIAECSLPFFETIVLFKGGTKMRT